MDKERKELEAIAMQLAEWAKRNNKDYVSACFIEDCVSVRIDTDDKDYRRFNVFFNLNEEDK